MPARSKPSVRWPRSDEAGRPTYWDNDAVQLCAQALLVEENLATLVPSGIIYYVGSKLRVEVPFDDALRKKTLGAIALVHELAAHDVPPEPLPPELRHRCFGCSLAPVCLPEETLYLIHQAAAAGPADAETLAATPADGTRSVPATLAADGTRGVPATGVPLAAASAADTCAVGVVDEATAVRSSHTPCAVSPATSGAAGIDQIGSAPAPVVLTRVMPGNDDKAILYVQEPGAHVGLRSEHLVISLHGRQISRVPIASVRQVVVFGNVQVSTQAIHVLMAAEVSLSYLSGYGRFIAAVLPAPPKNVALRAAQYCRVCRPAAIARPGSRRGGRQDRQSAHALDAFAALEIARGAARWFRVSGTGNGSRNGCAFVRGRACTVRAKSLPCARWPKCTGEFRAHQTRVCCWVSRARQPHCIFPTSAGCSRPRPRAPRSISRQGIAVRLAIR